MWVVATTRSAWADWSLQGAHFHPLGVTNNEPPKDVQKGVAQDRGCAGSKGGGQGRALVPREGLSTGGMPGGVDGTTRLGYGKG